MSTHQKNLDHWAEAAAEIDWFTPHSDVLDESAAPIYRWFPGATCNTAYNCLDRHVEAGRGEQDAIIYDSPITGTASKLTYRELHNRVAHFAAGMKQLGVEKGDTVIIYMPMVPEAIVAMLACARLGAVHSVVFGGFASRELASRIDDCKPKLLISASCGLEPGRVIAYKPLLDQALEISEHQPDHCIIFQREQELAELKPDRDLDWQAVEDCDDTAPCTPVAATDPLYILYTSGTTGQPKGVVRDNGGHMVALNWSMANVYNTHPGDVYWAASDIGWVVGHSYIVYGPLIRGATTILFEGKPVGTPDASTFWRIIAKYGVKVMFTAPTAIRAIKQQDPDGDGFEGFDISSLETFFLAGERADPDTIQWAEKHLKVPVIDHWWQTELGWPAIANCVGLGLIPVKYGSSGRAVPGFQIEALDEAGHTLPANEMGALAIKLPLPPGALPTLWNNDDGFIEKYLTQFPGYYSTGDAGYIDEDDYIFIMSRTDDVINVAGHRLSTGQMEEIITAHPDVAECAVFGINDDLKGQVPLALLILNKGVEKSAELIEQSVIRQVREAIGAVAVLKKVKVVSRLPKTRSGKILRGTLQKIANGEQFKTPATIDDPASLDEIKQVIKP